MFVLLLFTLVAAMPPKDVGGSQAPWSSQEALAPADLAATIRSGERQPTIVYVGYPALFRSGHIPNATLHGPASQDAGMADLKRWAAALPKDTLVVLYCGCCPLDQCPNVAPAFSALKHLGLRNVKVLMLPVSFAADWVTKGYPIER